MLRCYEAFILPHIVFFSITISLQVLAESLRVLDEIQDMIREELKLAPGAPLGNQPPGLMSRVPRPLLAALEVMLNLDIIS